MLRALKEQLRHDRDTVQELRLGMLFDRELYRTDIPNPKIEQHIVQAASFLELARISFNLAMAEIPEGNENDPANSPRTGS